jgi:ankyrin repeat protein
MINELGTLGRGVGIAIEAALKTERLNLAIKLLKRVKQNKTLNTDKQTLFHIMAKEINENKCNQELQQQIVKLLIEHEVNFLALDSLKSNAIIYAAINWNFVLCNELTNLIGLNRVSNLEPDSLLRTPVSAIFWGIFDKKNFSELPEEMQIWLTKLLEKSAQLNIQSYYPISESSYAGVRYVLSNPSTVNISAPKYSPLIASVINGNYSLVKYLLNLKMNGSFAVDVNYADSTGRTPLMHAVRLVPHFLFNLNT